MWEISSCQVFQPMVQKREARKNVHFNEVIKGNLEQDKSTAFTSKEFYLLSCLDVSGVNLTEDKCGRKGVTCSHIYFTCINKALQKKKMSFLAVLAKNLARARQKSINNMEIKVTPTLLAHS